MPLEQPVIRIDRWAKRVFLCGAVADSASGGIILCSRAARQRSDGEGVTTSGKTSTSVFRRAWVVLSDSVGHFNADDGWAMASHVALSGLMALFPFLIFVAALAGFVGQERLAEQVADFLFQAWPPEVAGPIADEVHRVVSGAGVNLLTVAAVIAAFLASSGVEAARVALNRAYRVVDRRSFLWLRAESLLFVLAGRREPCWRLPGGWPAGLPARRERPARG